MRAMHRSACWVLLLALASCNPGTDVDIGSLKVSVTTDGTSPDPDGYTIKIENRPGEPIGINGELTFTELLPGSYPVSLSGLAPNCFMQGAATVTVPVKAGQQAVATFNVNCPAANSPAANSYVRVTTQTTGNDPDPDGYLLRIGTGTAWRTTPNGVINLSAPEGNLPIELTDVASHCTPDPGNPTTVRAVAGQPTPLTLKVACADITGAMQIAVTTTGQDMQESGFQVRVDEALIERPFPFANGAQIRLLAGPHSVRLDTESLNSNCTVSGANPRSETVTVGNTTVVTIAVACAALAHVVVSVTTTGQDIDTDGYSLSLSNYDGWYYTGQSYALAIPANGTLTGPGMLPATYTVSLSGIASNCRQSIVFPSPVPVAGADVPLSITVVCNPARQLAFVTGVGTGAEIAIGSEASASFTRLTTNAVADSNPAWSPDGSRLSFTSARDGNNEIYTMNADGSDARRLTTSAGADYQPAWSSDGSRIAFVSERDGNAEIYVMGADGSAPVRLTTGTGIDVEPAWSPAGNRILFRSNRNTGIPAVYVMNADGSGVTRLTASAQFEASPAWSWSGKLIAFMRSPACVLNCNFNLYVMNANGSQETPREAYASSLSTSVSWGSDDRIAYTGTRCSDAYACDVRISVLRPDGSGATLPWALSSDPAWRP